MKGSVPVLKKIGVVCATTFLLFGMGSPSSTSAIAKGKEESVSLNGMIPKTASASTMKIEIKNGVTQPIYATDDAIVENLYVETAVDSDGDGKKDQVSIQVMRPKTDPGVKVPIIYEMSPYRSGLVNVPNHDVDHELTSVDEKDSHNNTIKNPTKMETKAKNLGSLGNYYVPRGYAVVLGESIGSGKSDGCPTIGDEKEILGTKAVIDWLNGRAKAFSESGEEVSAKKWSTGNVGMTGVSYNGTLPNAVATTGVEGLKTIVPVSAISSWYDYYRSNGAVVAPGGYQGEDADILAKAVLTRDNPQVCKRVMDELEKSQDRVTGDYSDFWDKRNYVKDAGNVKASVFIVHGLNDWNVKTKHFAQWWDALEENDVPRKMWLHQGGHGGTRANNYKETENRWFDYWLYGIENGIMDEPMVDIEREDRTWHQEANWPNTKSLPTALNLQAAQGDEAGLLSIQSVINPAIDTESLVDDPMTKASQLVSDPESESPNRLAYLTAELANQVRLSGTPKVSISASIDRPVANLTALLVDYGGSKPEIVTRGWMDPQNLKSDASQVAIVPDKTYTFTWDMQPDDYVFKKGHRIGIVLAASDYEYTIRPEAGTKITVNPDQSKVILPIVGGAPDLNLSTAEMKTLVVQLQENGDFNDDQAVHDLKLHLKSVAHFEKQESAKKIVKHMEGFKRLLAYQKKKNKLSERAYDLLLKDTERLISNWQQ